MLHGLIRIFYVLEFGVFSLCIMFSFLTHRLFRRVCLNFQISGWFFRVYLLMIDFCLKANTLISKQKHPPIYHAWPWGGIFLSPPTPNLLRECQCLHFTDEDTWSHTVVMCELELWAERGRQSTETQFFLVLKFSSATISSPVHSHRECEQIRALALAEGLGVHVIIPRMGTSCFCPAVILCPALHSFSLIKVLPSDCRGDFWQTHILVTSSPHFSHPVRLLTIRVAKNEL